MGFGSGERKREQIFLLWTQLEELPTEAGCGCRLTHTLERSHRSCGFAKYPLPSGFFFFFFFSHVLLPDTQIDFRSFQVGHSINHKQNIDMKEI